MIHILFSGTIMISENFYLLHILQLQYKTRLKSGLFGKIHANIYIGEEVHKADHTRDDTALRLASCTALADTMYAFKELPDELVDSVWEEKGKV